MPGEIENPFVGYVLWISIDVAPGVFHGLEVATDEKKKQNNNHSLHMINYKVTNFE